MKIAILTFVHAYNYGAELQCFALQYKLRKQSYNVEVLDVYRPNDDEYIHSKETDKRFSNLFSHTNKSDIIGKFHIYVVNCLEQLFKIIYKEKYKTRKENFSGFHEKYTNLSSKKYYNFNDLYSGQLDYTHYIVGSDQVWNYSNYFSIEPYLLPFVKNGKKISYAASIGHSEIPDILYDIYKSNLNSFDSISVRESQGAQVLKEVTGREDIKTVLDPTLLLTKEEWCQALSIEINNNKPYVLLYLLSRSTYSIELALKLAARNNWDVIVITPGITPQYNYKNVQYICGASPRKFVELFAGASFVITNSFHGTAFSVNFRVPFISTTRYNKRYNSRFVNLLHITYLENRLVFEDDKDYTIIDTLGKCDFSKSVSVLQDERNASLTFLYNSLA